MTARAADATEGYGAQALLACRARFHLLYRLGARVLQVAQAARRRRRDVDRRLETLRGGG